MKKTLITFLAVQLLFAYGMPTRATLAAQQTPARKAQARPAAEGKDWQKEAQKKQALDSLGSILGEASAIEGFEECALLVSRAAELLWAHDEARARAELLKLFDEQLGLYESELREQKQDREAQDDLGAALRIILKALGRKDPVAAEAAMLRYHKAKEGFLNDVGSQVMDVNEKLSLARESLDLNAEQSTALALRAIGHGIPATFPAYLYELKRRDRAAADGLFRKALSVLAGGQTYTPTQALYLSTYAFNEGLILVPSAVPRESEAKPQEFGIFTNELKPTDDKFDDAAASAYLAAAGQFLNARLAAGSPNANDPVFLGISYFLIKKAGLYAAKRGLGARGQWTQTETAVNALALSAGLKGETLAGLAGFAERLVADNNIFQFDGGASFFDRAKNTSDQWEKMGLLIQGIMQLVEERKFDEATRRLSDISQPEVRDQLALIVNFRAGKAAAEAKDWAELQRRVGQVVDVNARLFLLLEGARVAKAQRRNPVALEYLHEALGVSGKVKGKKDQAQGLIAAARIFDQLDAQRQKETLRDALKVINAAADYDGEPLQLKLAVPGSPNFYEFSLADSSLEASIERAAKSDWADTASLINQFSSRSIQLRAQLAACRAVL